MYLLFDIGGTKTRLAISSDGKTLGASKIISTEKQFDKFIENFKSTSDELSGYKKIDYAAGGLKGPLDKNKTTTLNPPDLPDWVNKPFKFEFEKIFGCPVLLENDTALAGLGEANLGAGKGKKIVVYITVSTGVGGVRIVNGKVDENTLGFEPGHQIIVPNGNPCGCGGNGHLEAYISGTALQNLKGIKAEDIKDPEVWDNVAKYLSLGLNNAAVFWSPDIIVLGGSVMQSIPLNAVKKYFSENLTIFKTAPPVVLSEHGDNSALLGALKLVGQSLNLL